MIKKIISAITVILFLVTCSSSGGEGGNNNGGGGVTTPAPIDVTRDIPFNPNDPHNAQEAKADKIDGTGVTVGIIDSNFDVYNIEFRAANGASRIIKDNNYPGNTNIHGSLVAEIIGGKTSGVAPGVKIRGEAAGSICSDGSNSCIVVQRGMYENLYNNGVRIYNQSFGVASRTIRTVTRSDMSLSDPVIAFYRDKASTDSLFIWAAGNSAKDEVSAEAGLPYLYTEMQKGWIAVIAVNSEDGLPSTYSNKCGVAQNWCIVAVGDYNFNVRNVSGMGTSFAAPAVTGAAVLVQAKYPWMNGDLIKQTILSTATDKGNKDVDTVYGWGLLNISKAVKGPALFDKRLAAGDYVYVTFNDVTSTFENDIAGDAGLIKAGTGKLILSGKNTYTGKNVINGGILEINGQVISEINVQIGGILSSNGGYIKNNVINNGGIVSAVGRGMDIQGNYISTPEGIIVNSAGATIKVNGTVDLNNSTLKVTAPRDVDDNPIYISKDIMTKNIISAANGITSTFGKVEIPVFLQSEITYDNNNIKLNMVRRDIAEYAEQAYNSDATRNNSSANLEQILTALDNNEGSSAFRTKIAILQQSSASDLAAILDSLSGQIYASAQALTFQQSQTVNRDLTNRLVMLGSMENKSDVAGLWFSGIASAGKLKESGYASADTSAFGGQFGIDKVVTDNLILGTAVSYSDADANFDRYGGKSKSQNLGVSLYGRYGRKEDNFYILGRLGAGFVSSDVDREIVTGNQIEKVAIDHDDYVYSGYGETGYKFKLAKNFSLTPFAGIVYDSVKRGNFIENGSLMGLQADSKIYDQTSGSIGLRGEYTFKWMGVKSTITGYASWQKAFNNETLDFEASYAGIPLEKFTVEGIGLSNDSMWIGMGINTEINEKWACYVNYDMKMSDSDISSNMFSAGFKYSIKK
ncbi:MAG: autotransporter domain-containing protein [Fusobacteriales bacterium]|nr:autotransporter domain-containing protein [Fusobacteriales bacterium]